MILLLVLENVSPCYSRTVYNMLAALDALCDLWVPVHYPEIGCPTLLRCARGLRCGILDCTLAAVNLIQLQCTPSDSTRNYRSIVAFPHLNRGLGSGLRKGPCRQTTSCVLSLGIISVY